MRNLALYIHWPFCESKCPYCDFNSHVSDSIEQNIWLESYIKELDYYKSQLGDKFITSIFFGGGTPSLMNPSLVSDLLNHISKIWKISDRLEITIEANPSSSEIRNFKSLKDSGINRLSIGIQSFNDNELSFLGRKHNALEGMKALEAAQNIFDKNFSFDIIYALPNQTEEDLENTLNTALKFNSNHLSLYQLTIEKGTPFYRDYSDGKFELPSEDKALELYQYVNHRLSDNNIHRYEISNYAKPTFECKHNISYWEYDEYLGIGPGAHSRINIDGKRTAIFDTHTPQKWLSQVGEHQHGVQSKNILTTEELADEFIFMGLRLTKGLNIDKFKEVTSYEFNDYYKQEFIGKMIEENYLSKNQKHISLTDKGLMLHSSICANLSKNILV